MVYQGPVKPDLLCLQMEGNIKVLEEMEETMDQVYTREIARQKVEDDSLIVVLTVAVLYSDMDWHRGKVVGVNEELGMVEIEFLDWGWRAFVRSDNSEAYEGVGCEGWSPSCTGSQGEV